MGHLSYIELFIFITLQCYFLVTAKNYVSFSERSSETLSDIVGEVISKEPKRKLEVFFGEEAEITVVGCDLGPGKADHAPTKLRWGADPLSYYALAMVDPDAKEQDNIAGPQFLHWLVVNIPGDLVDRGRELAPYQPPRPSGNFHRYALLIYVTKKPVDYKVVSLSMRQRKSFDIEKFADDHNLGDPLAANFFQAAEKSYYEESDSFLLCATPSDN